MMHRSKRSKLKERRNKKENIDMISLKLQGIPNSALLIPNQTYLPAPVAE